MVKYRTPQNEIDEMNKNRVLGVIRYYTFKEGGVDLNKVNPTTLLHRFGIEISLNDAKNFVQELISEGKVEKVS